MIWYSPRFLTFCIYQTRKNQEEIDKYIKEIERNNRLIKENDDFMKQLEMIDYNNPLYKPLADDDDISIADDESEGEDSNLNESHRMQTLNVNTL